jgi:hypothetical protein
LTGQDFINQNWNNKVKETLFSQEQKTKGDFKEQFCADIGN